MSMSLDNETKRQTACEAAYLLNEITRQLWASSLVLELLEPWLRRTPTPFWKIGTVRNMVMTSTIVNLYRLEEARDKLLTGWLLTEEQLRTFGFFSLEEFIGGKGKWKSFVMLRHQYAGHATANKGEGNKPGKIVSAKLLGEALRETGVFELEAFLKRVEEQLLPGAFKTIDELNRLYPEVTQFITEDYPLELEKGRLGR